jgi:hypothetical protein
MKKQSSLFRRIVIVSIVLVLTGQACALSLFDNPFNNPTPIPPNAPPTGTPLPIAPTTFTTVLPEALQPGEKLVIAILDEVTGLSINPIQYQMSARDSLTYTAAISLPLNSVVKYIYIRSGASSNVLEDAASGAAIRYRMAYITGPAEIRDLIADWGDKNYMRQTGIIFGQVFNADTGSPLPNMLVTAGGIQSFTDSRGKFELPDLPSGTHNLMVYSLDGIYQPFQQGAVVAENSATVVDARVKPAPMVNVTFSVAVPDTMPGVPVRIAGNIWPLGNTFTNLQGGISVIPERMPIMSLQSDGRYTWTYALPVGTHIQYKYTLGDGFWNAEHKHDGAWVLREFIVPAQDVTLQDAVDSWAMGSDSAPILFEVSVPPVTPPGDIIYIQFNAFGWMEPIPMWPLGNNMWAYKLYGPLNMLGSFNYRYCRNGQCGSADDTQTIGMSASGRKAITSFTSQDLKDTVGTWKWYENPEPATLVGTSITPRTGGFIAGVELQSTYRPNWSYYAPQALTNVQALGANTVIITPTWTFTQTSPPRFNVLPGQDPMWTDSAVMISQARALGLNVVIFPAANFPLTPVNANPRFASSAGFWLSAPRDAQWWQTWFARYRAFAVNYADLATQTGAQTLILGGEWTAPALPNGKLPDGNPSTPPADVESQWKAIIAEVRNHFRGQVMWALPYTKASLETPFNFLQDVDGIYLLWSASLSTNPSATKTDYANAAGQLLDNEVSPLFALVKKPIILAIAYPSAIGTANGCIPDNMGNCADWTALNRPNEDLTSVNLSLQTQADLYEAMLTAVNSRQWISGFVTRGYYPPAALQDKSASVHSKPAADILWYWFPRLTGAVR